MLLKIGDAERHDVLRVEQVALSKAHDTFSMATELHVTFAIVSTASAFLR